MTAYLIKVILCSALFMFFYKAMLEQEHMFRVNRFYLLSSLLSSFFIPLLSLNPAGYQLGTIEYLAVEKIVAASETGDMDTAAGMKDIQLFQVFVIIYFIVSSILVFRFIMNLKGLHNKIRKGPVIKYGNYKIVLIAQDIAPHSFLKYIFISEKEYNAGVIRSEIISHELAHTKQKHSLDILLLELIRIFFWFNPVLFLYRNSLLLNHEFLADEEVLKQFSDVKSYQNLLLEKAQLKTHSTITSKFNYSITKKRLLMMTKTTAIPKLIGKVLAIVPVLALALFLFSDKAMAQNNPEIVKTQEVKSTVEGITPDQLSEYEQIINKAKNEKGQLMPGKFSANDVSRLQELFLAMSKEQQAKQVVFFMSTPPPLPKSVPTAEQLESWKNSKKYGVWINNKRVSNTELNKYKNTDFAKLFVSKLSRNAINYGKHYYQVDLMTTDFYAAYVKQSLEKKQEYTMAFRRINKN